jgi:flavin reductase (DIM6/NTAB) family NADH-FMN oxidoreductase RutF
MQHFDPKDMKVPEVYRLLQGGVAPRPIALVSTLSSTNIRNLSPFSFFNTFGGNPPTVAFSPSRRQRDGTFKDTYTNLAATRECVIQAVTYAMVQQVSLASTEYASDVDEFAKSGLTPIASDIVKPPRVAESPFQMECILKQMIATGDGPGAGNIAICEVVRFHVDENIWKDGQIDPQLIDLVGRNSADWYTHASGDAIFYVKKPNTTIGIGYDSIPQFIRDSDVLSANNLGQLGNSERLPTGLEAQDFAKTFPAAEGDPSEFERCQRLFDYRMMFRIARTTTSTNPERTAVRMELAARCALESANDHEFAWMALLYAEMVRRRDT